MKNRTFYITGASRGIGKAIALRLAREKANIAIAAKTVKPHPKLEGTIFTAAEEIEKAGGKAFSIQVDIRDEDNVKESIEKTVEHFGSIDGLINNASAINLNNTVDMEMKRYDLIHDINVRGTFMVSKYCIPYLKKGINPHILTLSPPLNMSPKWFAKHLAYTMSKYGMSMTVLGLSEELRNNNIAVNALWPQTTIATAAVRNIIGGEDLIRCSRTPDIMADAAYVILSKNGAECTGNFFVDEEVLRKEGITDFNHYAVDTSKQLMPDFFL